MMLGTIPHHCIVASQKHAFAVFAHYDVSKLAVIKCDASLAGLAEKLLQECNIWHDIWLIHIFL